MTGLPRLIAFYLPQFHPIPENDIWWGKGFTEWANVGKAKPLFPGHNQPKVPTELGYYDLRVPETRKAQADLAKEYGIEGFCYWHYWFGNGKQLLERPFNEVLASGEPSLPFCLAWANESWKGFWHGLTNRQILIEQEYPGIDDYTKHFLSLLPAFNDSRYIRVDNKPIFVVYKPFQLPNAKEFISLWQKLAVENGLNGVYFIGIAYEDSEIETIKGLGFDSVNINGHFNYKRHRRPMKNALLSHICRTFYGCKQLVFYSDASKYFVTESSTQPGVFPTVIPNWDHTPRTGKDGLIFYGSTPDLFYQHLLSVKDIIKGKDHEHNLVFIKSWNEWAEGNYLEPDREYGRQYLEKIHDVLGKREK